jgi:hypothetical protein
MPDFSSILNKKAADVEKPPLPPQGSYIFEITKVPEFKEVGGGDWDMLIILCKAVEAMDNVDTDDYKGDITGIRLSKTFLFNKNDEAEFAKTEYSLAQFLENHVGVIEDGMSLGEALNVCKGARFIGDVKWRADNRVEGEFQAEIGRTAPAD